MHASRIPHLTRRTALARWRHVVALGAAVVGLFASHPLRAQEAFGTLRSATRAAPLSGVLVTVSLARNDSTIVRTTTNALGTYRVRTGTDSVIVRALRVGQRPVELARVRLRAGERREVGGELPDEPVSLVTVSTQAEQSCHQDPVDGSLVAELFADAHTALSLSRVSAEAVRARTTLRQVVQQFDTRERPVGEPEVQQHTLFTLQPFRSVPVDTLLEHGFRELLPDNVMVWNAPDAQLLTDDRFLSAYCLRLVPESPEDPSTVGVAFEPARARSDVIQVHGVLWLDRRTHALLRITYGYRGVESALASATPGGVVQYAHLDNGVWFVNDWSLRMPLVTHMTRNSAQGATAKYMQTHGILVASGHVVSVHVGDELLYATGEDTGPTQANDLVMPLLALRDGTQCEDASEEMLAMLSGMLRDVAGEPAAGVLVRASWRERADTGGDVEREIFTHTGVDGRFWLCNLPRSVTLEVVAGSPDAPLASTTMRLRSDATNVTIELRAAPPPG